MDAPVVLLPYKHCYPSKPVEKEKEEEKFYQQISDSIAALPAADGWLPGTAYHQYQGYWYPAAYLTGVMACQRHFQALSSDIVLTTFPRSGTTWFKSLIFSTLHRRTHCPSSPSHPLLSHNPHELTPFIEFLYGTRVPELASLPSPRFYATHIPYATLPDSIKQSRCKIIHVYRSNASANMVSMWRFNLEGRDEQQLPLEKAVELYAEGRTFFGPVWDNVGGYWTESLRDPERVMFLRYEEAEKDPVAALRKVAGFIGCPFSDEEEACGVPSEIMKLCCFDKLSKVEVNKLSERSPDSWTSKKNKAFFSKEENGKWVRRLPPEMVERLDKLMDEKMSAYGLKP